MRTFRVAILAVLLGGCSGTATVDVPQGDRIECAVGGSETFAPDCTIERAAGGGSFTLRHADGGFRRFDVDAVGVITPADGADTATSTGLSDGRTELKIGGDRYRLPAVK